MDVKTLWPWTMGLLGGYKNTITVGNPEAEDPAAMATISGGGFNQALGYYSVIGGGLSNRVEEHTSTIAGGNENKVTAVTGTVAGGEKNLVSGQRSFIGGGGENSASGAYGTIAGGLTNEVVDYGSVGGGNLNKATGTSSATGGGYSNEATGWSTVSGGQQQSCRGLQWSFGGFREHCEWAIVPFLVAPAAAAGDWALWVCLECQWNPVHGPREQCDGEWLCLSGDQYGLCHPCDGD